MPAIKLDFVGYEPSRANQDSGVKVFNEGLSSYFAMLAVAGEELDLVAGRTNIDLDETPSTRILTIEDIHDALGRPETQQAIVEKLGRMDTCTLLRAVEREVGKPLPRILPLQASPAIPLRNASPSPQEKAKILRLHS